MTSQPRRSAGGLQQVLRVLAVLSLVAATVLGAGPSLLGQTFRSSVDLIAVDVHVAGRNGQPLTILTPADVEVTIDGHKRRVLSATFTRHQLTPLPSMAGGLTSEAVRSDGPGSAQVDDGGRTFIVSIDTASFRGLDAHVAILAAQRFIRQLAPADAVGVYTLPQGPLLAPTTSHATVNQAIGRIVGRKLATSQFAMTVEQVIDITATAATQSMMASRRSIGQMMQDDKAAGDQIDCSGPANACTEAALNEAESLANTLEEEVMDGLNGLNSLLRLLQASPGRKTVLLLSGGMPVSDRSGGRPNLGTEVKRLGEEATYANATIHALYFDQDLNASFTAGTRKPRSSTGRTRGIYTRALAEFSEPSGGTLSEVSTGAGEQEIDRLLAQTATYYVLGVEPDARDRDGRPHRLGVKVRQRDATIRSRELVVVPPVRK
ncbi:MAG: VWA domain-containing protein [Vicinamibacterales bacterium]